MTTCRRCFVLFFGLALLLSACAPKIAPNTEQQALALAWAALEPNTSSHDPSNWETADIRKVQGNEVSGLFAGQPAPGCWQGPTPPENKTISGNRYYWYVQMKPRVATPIPASTQQFSPTAPPNIPEPFLYQAEFLIDAGTGQITARKLSCIIY